MPHVHFLEGFPFLMNRTDLTALTIAFLVVLTMPIFAVVSRGRPRDADVARRPTTILLGYWIRDWVMWFIGPLDRFLIRNRVSPDVFNWLGLAFGLASPIDRETLRFEKRGERETRLGERCREVKGDVHSIA